VSKVLRIVAERYNAILRYNTKKQRLQPARFMEQAVRTMFFAMCLLINSRSMIVGWSNTILLRA
jgi:hypothetical protein